MSDDPSQRDARDRSQVASGQEYEVRHLIESLQKQHPTASEETIEAAYLDASQGGVTDREELKRRIAAKLEETQ